MTTQNTKEITKEVRNMDKEHTLGKTDPNILENGWKTESTVKESIPGMMEDNTKETGKTIIWMDMVFTHGKTEGNIKDSIRKIRNMD